MLTALVCKTPKNHLDFLIDYLVVVRELGRDFASDSTVRICLVQSTPVPRRPLLALANVGLGILTTGAFWEPNDVGLHRFRGLGTGSKGVLTRVIA